MKYYHDKIYLKKITCAGTPSKRRLTEFAARWLKD